MMRDAYSIALKHVAQMPLLVNVVQVKVTVLAPLGAAVPGAWAAFPSCSVLGDLGLALAFYPESWDAAAGGAQQALRVEIPHAAHGPARCARWACPIASCSKTGVEQAIAAPSVMVERRLAVP